MKSKLISAVLSVLVAMALWLYVITTVSPGSKETIYNIPVVLANETVLNERGFFLCFFLLIVHGGFQYPDKIAAGFCRCIRIGVFDCSPGQKERDGKQNCGQ